MSALDHCFVKECACHGKVTWHVREFPNDPHHKFTVEHAKSGQSTCTRGCGEQIAKGAIRMGAPLKDARGCQRVISGWTHLECTMLTELRAKFGPMAPEFDCHGFWDLDDADQEVVRAEFAREDRVPDRAIDPNSRAFLPQRALPRVSPPASISVPLLPYQEEGFGWMRGRERGGCENAAVRGGILADEMGMGKTLQAVALLAADADEDKRDARKKASADAPPPEVLDSKDGSHAYELPRTTLIVLPSSALFQWASELERFWVGPSAPKVLLYYSKRKGLTPAALAGYDVVLTTYPVLENEYRARVNVTKLECEFCKRKMLPRKLKMHYKYQCGPLSERTEKQQLTMRAAGDESAPSVKMPKRRKVPKADSGPLNSAALKSEKAPKKPGGPKAARSAFHHYLEATKDAVAAEVRLTEAPEKGAAAALQRSRWKDLGKAARAPYQATADADKKRYEEEAEEVDDEELECTPVVSQAAKAAKAAKADDDDGDATAPPAKAPSAKAPSAKAAVGAAAMERLVVASRPTPSNIYKDLMRDAGRADEILSQFTPGNSAKGRKAAVSQEASQGSADADASQGGGARKRKASPADAPPEKARARAGATPRESIDVEEDSRRAGQKEHDDTCALCGADGELLCCDACPAALHVCCAGLDAVPDGCWHCPTCVLKRDEPKRLSGGAKLPRTLRPKSRGSPVGSPVRAARALDRLGHVSPQINRRSASTTNLPRINDDEAAAQHVVEGAKFEIESAKHVQSNYDSEDDLDAASHELLDRGDRDARDALLARNELEAMQHENAALRKRVEELEACTLTPRRRLREVASNTTADVVAMKKERDECRDQLDCALCMERPRSVAFFPCTHLCACAECAAQCSECPQCRRAVQSKLQVIIS